MLWGIRVPHVGFDVSPSTGISGETLRQPPNGTLALPRIYNTAEIYALFRCM
jgi:hypothetical protein